MPLLSRADLLKKEKLTTELVDLGNDEFVYVRQMTGREKDYFEQSLIKETKNEKGVTVGFEKSLDDFKAKLAVVTLCDEGGMVLMSPKDYPILSQHMSAAKLEKIVAVSQRLNGMTEPVKEEILKNSEAVLNGNSTSGSVEN